MFENTFLHDITQLGGTGPVGSGSLGATVWNPTDFYAPYYPSYVPIVQPAPSESVVIEGFGAAATGGTGGTTINVTTLANTGAGSLRNALLASGPRIIKFTVSGLITLTTDIDIVNNDFTLDGSDAPNKGVGVTGACISVGCSNFIIRHMRIGSGNLGGSSIDSLRLAGDTGCVDHCTVRWGDDGNLDVTGGTNVTVQWCIIGQSLGPTDAAGHMLIKYDANNVSIHHNLFYGGQRNPECGGGNVDWVNNVIYRNWTAGVAPGGHYVALSVLPPDTSAIHANWVKNYYKAGGSEVLGGSGWRELYLYGDRPFSGASTIYLLGNIAPNRPVDTGSETTFVEMDTGGFTVQGTPHSFPAVTTTSAAQAYTDVLAGAGARLPVLDSVDTALLAHVAAGSGGAISHESDVGGWPDYTV